MVAYLVARRTVAEGLLLCLDVLIAADLMSTVSVNLTIASIAALGMLVLVRTILTFSIQVEMEGGSSASAGEADVEASQVGV